MTEIGWQETAEGCYIEARGHAGYHPGNDIICSAVSVLMQTLYAGLDGICGVYAREAHGDGWMRIAAEKNAEAAAVFHSVLLGLSLLAEEYPEYVQIEPLSVGCRDFWDGLE